MELEYLAPRPRKIEVLKTTFARPDWLNIEADTPCRPAARALRDDLIALAGLRVSPQAPFPVRLEMRPGETRPEGYRLALGKTRAEIVASDLAGLSYGAQTLLQLFVLGDPASMPTVRITDWPEYRLRSFMVDLGRAPFSLDYLKRIVRILARLKMNALHLHLNDDQLCGLRFRDLPLGSENPFAIDLDDLADLVSYARKHHVSILPEFECWGHAGSVIYHFPELYGAPGMWGGMSFGIGEELFGLLGRVFRELLPALEPECIVHTGLDEAQWATLPSVPAARRDEYGPRELVGRVYDTLQQAAEECDRAVTMHLWADHGGRPLPERIEHKVVVEPWMYHEFRADDIRRRIEQYGGDGKTPFMMGAGSSSVHYAGHFGATRHWCRLARGLPNVEGVTVCLWETNDLPGRMVTLYGGAEAAWSPESPVRKEKDTTGELIDREVRARMRRWQAAFRDADDEALRAESGPEVDCGVYCWGERAGSPVAPTVRFEMGG